jgi:hypothetical protein
LPNLKALGYHEPTVKRLNAPPDGPDTKVFRMIKPVPIITACVLLTAGLAVRAEDVAPVPVDGKITWIYDYETGKQLARRLQRPMFVVFRCER